MAILGVGDKFMYTEELKYFWEKECKGALGVVEMSGEVVIERINESNFIVCESGNRWIMPMKILTDFLPQKEESDDSEIQVGDICEVISGGCGVRRDSNSTKVLITTIDQDGSLHYDILNDNLEKIDHCYFCLKPKDLKKIRDTKKSISLTKNTTMANLTDKFKQALKKEPKKSFNKIGLTDSQDRLTEEGKDLLMNWLLEKFEIEFNKDVIAPMVASEKKTPEKL